MANSRQYNLKKAFFPPFFTGISFMTLVMQILNHFIEILCVLLGASYIQSAYSPSTCEMQGLARTALQLNFHLLDGNLHKQKICSWGCWQAQPTCQGSTYGYFWFPRGSAENLQPLWEFHFSPWSCTGSHVMYF